MRKGIHLWPKGRKTTMPIIDAHAHIYPDKIAAQAAHAISELYMLSAHCSGFVDTLLETERASDLTHFIVHSVATSAHSVPHINDFIAAQCDAHPEFIGFGAMHPDFEDMESEVERAASLGLHGFKLHPDSQRVNIDDPRLMKFYEIIEGRFPVVIHTGDYRYDYSHPRRLKRVLEAFPGLVVDAAHYGGWTIFEQGYDYLHDAPNPERLFIDTSSSVMLLGARRSRELIDMWGVDHVMFGSDFPLWDPAAELDAFRNLGFSPAELEKMLCANAERFAGVSVS